MNDEKYIENKAIRSYVLCNCKNYLHCLEKKCLIYVVKTIIQASS